MGSTYAKAHLLRFVLLSHVPLALRAYIYIGKILADANTVESYKIEEKGFIVCMVSKPKAAPVATSSASTAPPPATPAQPVSTPAQPPAPQPNPAAAPANPPQTPTPAQPQTATAGAEGGGFNDPSAMFMGDRREETIREMENMGFARPEIERALRAAFFNPDRAIEYLLSGIPENVQPPQRQAAPAANPPAGQTATSPPAAPAAPAAGGEANPDEPVNLFEAAAAAAGGQGGGARGAGRGAGAGAVAGAGAGAGAGLGAGIGAGLGAAAAGAGGQGGAVNMDFLRQSPHFQHLRQLVQQQPAMLEPILQQVAEGNPQLAQLIGQNEQQFLQLLSEVMSTDEHPHTLANNDAGCWR